MVGSVDQILNAPRLGEFGVRYFQTDRIAVGASLDLFAFSGNSEFERPDESTSSQDRSGSEFRVRLWTEAHLGPRRGAVSPFAGVGVGASRGTFTARRESVECRPDSGLPCRTFEEETTGSQFALASDASVGAEVAVTRAITLGASYRLGVDVQRFSDEATRDGEPAGTGSGGSLVLRSGFTPIWLSVRL